jgi:sugar diacid utilization regulator
MTQEQIDRIRRTLTDLIDVVRCGEECSDLAQIAQADLDAFNQMVIVYNKAMKKQQQQELEVEQSKRKSREREAVFFANSPDPWVNR